MISDAIKNKVEWVFAQSKKMCEDGVFLPVCFVFSGELADVAVIDPSLFTSETSRKLVFEQMRKMAGEKKGQIDAVVFSSQAWLASATPEEHIKIRANELSIRKKMSVDEIREKNLCSKITEVLLVICQTGLAELRIEQEIKTHEDGTVEFFGTPKKILDESVVGIFKHPEEGGRGLAEKQKAKSVQ